MNKDFYNILFCGIGGQGVLTASEICGWASLYDGYSVKKSEVHGMSQRGGSVESHLRFGKIIYSPLIPIGDADILVSFYADEHKRMLPYLKKDGIDLIDALQEAEKIGDNRFINIYLLGVLSKYLPVGEESWIKAIKKVLSKMTEKNIEYFLKGKNS